MTHTAIDLSLAKSKHDLVTKISIKLLEVMEEDLISMEASRELARVLLDTRDDLDSRDSVLNFLKKISEDYPFLMSLYKEELDKKVGEKKEDMRESIDAQKLKSIQDQLSKIVQS